MPTSIFLEGCEETETLIFTTIHFGMQANHVRHSFSIISVNIVVSRCFCASAIFKHWKHLLLFPYLPKIKLVLCALCTLCCLNIFQHLFAAWNIKEILEVLLCINCTSSTLAYITHLKCAWILNNTLLPCCHSLHV